MSRTYSAIGTPEWKANALALRYIQAAIHIAEMLDGKDGFDRDSWDGFFSPSFGSSWTGDVPNTAETAIWALWIDERSVV